jgi:Protein of unknown function (DUF3429)
MVQTTLAHVQAQLAGASSAALAATEFYAAASRAPEAQALSQIVRTHSSLRTPATPQPTHAAALPAALLSCSRAQSSALSTAAATAAPAAASSATKAKPDLDAYPRDATQYPCAPGSIKIKPHRSGWAAVPAVPKFLGLSGLIPFFGLSPPILHAAATSMSTVDALQPLAHTLLTDLYPFSGMLQIGYGTAIVSFLGAVHWGAAMQSRTGTTTKLMFERYIWSVTPALVVFPAAAWGVQTGSVIVLSALVATFAIDAKFNWKGALPKWYMALRLPLALGSMAAMFITVWHAQAHGDRLASPDTRAAAFR